MKRFIASLLFTCAIAGSVQAATLSYAGTTTTTLAGFDLTSTTGLTNGTTIFRERFAGDGLYLSGPSNLTLTYLGKEAGDTDVFRMPGATEIFRNSTTIVGTQKVLTNVAGGLLDFSFKDLFAALLVQNGCGASGLIGSIGVFMESATSALVFFNDAGNDRDYDDMAVRVQVSPVPLPAALPLFAAAVGGAGFISRRRRKA